MTAPGILAEYNIRSVRELELEAKRVMVRVDFNVPLDEDGAVRDDARIRAALPTLELIRDAGGRIVVCSHLGRPKGKRAAEFSWEPAATRLAELLDCEVLLPDDCVGDAAAHLVANQRPGQIVLLENLRFHPGETENSEDFARKLVEMCDIYINDAFGTLHRAHASVSALPRLVPDRGAGLLVERELSYLSRLTGGGDPPYFAILGGAKISDKIEVIERLIAVVDGLVIGGAMGCTFLAAQGIEMGRSKVEADRLVLARHLLARCEQRGVKVFLPTDHLVVKALDDDSVARVAFNGDLEADDIAVDIGPETAARFAQVLTGGDPDIAAPRTVLWNGPMGLFEMDRFAGGTNTVAKAIAQSAATSVIGGGDSAAAVRKAGVTPLISHISTGGGATLEFLGGKTMPGLAALRGGRR